MLYGFLISIAVAVVHLAGAAQLGHPARRDLPAADRLAGGPDRGHRPDPGDHLRLRHLAQAHHRRDLLLLPDRGEPRGRARLGRSRPDQGHAHARRQQAGDAVPGRGAERAAVVLLRTADRRRVRADRRGLRRVRRIAERPRLRPDPGDAAAQHRPRLRGGPAAHRDVDPAVRRSCHFWKKSAARGREREKNEILRDDGPAPEAPAPRGDRPGVGRGDGDPRARGLQLVQLILQLVGRPRPRAAVQLRPPRSASSSGRRRAQPGQPDRPARLVPEPGPRVALPGQVPGRLHQGRAVRASRCRRRPAARTRSSW